jgi:hypothetical protein
LEDRTGYGVQSSKISTGVAQHGRVGLVDVRKPRRSNGSHATLSDLGIFWLPALPEVSKIGDLTSFGA